MTKEMSDLIKEITDNAYAMRVVECKSWRWCIGSMVKSWHFDENPKEPTTELVKTEESAEPVEVVEKPYPLAKPSLFRLDSIVRIPENAIPDFSDGRTVGLLLFLVRMTYGDADATPEFNKGEKNDPTFQFVDPNLRYSFVIKSTKKSSASIRIYGRSMLDVLVSALELADKLGYAD